MCETDQCNIPCNEKLNAAPTSKLHLTCAHHRGNWCWYRAMRWGLWVGSWNTGWAGRCQADCLPLSEVTRRFIHVGSLHMASLLAAPPDSHYSRDRRWLKIPPAPQCGTSTSARWHYFTQRHAALHCTFLDCPLQIDVHQACAQHTHQDDGGRHRVSLAPPLQLPAQRQPDIPLPSLVTTTLRPQA
jgi:hypothetical protein